MASTYSSNLKIELIGTGEQTGTWGQTTNSNFSNVFEQSIVGRATVNFATDANKTLSASDSVSSQDFRNVYLNLTSSGSLTATRDLIVPTINKNYIVQNNTTGSQSIRVITAAGTGITVPNGSTGILYVDGTNVIQAFDYLPTLTVPTLNVTTIDLTNLEVTNIKAKDGTASASIADSTGAFTVSAAFAANGGVTLGDASGDALTINSSAVSIPNGLNFDSNTFVIDATNNRVGVGTASPARQLHISGTTPIIQLTDTDTGANSIVSASSSGGSLLLGADEDNTVANSSMSFRVDGSESMRILDGNVGIGTTSPNVKLHVSGSTPTLTVEATDATDSRVRIIAGNANISYVEFGDPDDVDTGEIRYDHSSNFMSFATNANVERMRITSTGNVGIGTSSPSAELHLQSNGSNVDFRFTRNDGSGEYGGQLVGTDGATTAAIRFLTVSAGTATERMRLDSSGNLGLGVTPSAWRSTERVLQLPDGAFYTGSNYVAMGQNYYIPTGGGSIYIESDEASDYYQLNGTHVWRTAASGTAGNAITWTTAMTLDASGNLGIGTTSPFGATSNRIVLSVNGTTDSMVNLGVNGTRTANFYTSVSSTVFGTETSIPLNFQTAATTRLTIDSTGNALFTKAVRATITTDNDLSFDMNAASNFKCTPTGGGALTFTNITSGQTGNIILVNGANYAITAAATTKVSSTCLATISATGTYWLSYYSDGTNVYVANTGALA